MAFVGTRTRRSDPSRELFAAVDSGDTARVSSLLQKSVDVNCTNSLGETPLHLASKRSNYALMKLLCEARADLSLATAASKSTPLLLASLNTSLSAVLLLLHHRANPNDTNINGNSVLHLSATNGSLSIAAMLLDHRADVNVGNYRNMTPLHCAAKRGRHQMIELLIHRGANKEALDDERQTPLHVALDFNTAHIVATTFASWSVERHSIAPQRVKDQIHTIMIIRSSDRDSMLTALPNELLFLIFEAL